MDKPVSNRNLGALVNGGYKTNGFRSTLYIQEYRECNNYVKKRPVKKVSFVVEKNSEIYNEKSKE